MAKKIYFPIHRETAPLVKGVARSYPVCLGPDAPTGDVTVSITEKTTSYLTLPSNLTFTSSNYLTPQAVALTATADGVVEGQKDVTIIITASGGGYNLTREIDLVITDSGLDSQFLKAYKWLTGINITSTANIATKRTLLTSGDGSTFRGIFNTAGLTTDDTPNTIDTNLAGATTIGQTTVGALVGAAGVDRLTWIMADGAGANWTNLVYHIRNSTPNNVCVMVCGGHGSETEHLNCLNDLLAEGFDILYAFMPQTFQNTEASAAVTGTGVSGHNGILTGGIDSASFMALELFFFDKIKSINYCITNYSYTDYFVTGCSGGGLTALIVAALDTRVSKCVEIRGVKPIPFRAFTDEGTAASWDYEQGPTGPINTRNTTNCGTRVDALLQAVSYYDIIVLAAINNDGTPRRLHMTHHAADSCCHGKFTYNLWKDYMKSHIESLGGSFDLTLSTDAAYATHGFRANDRAIMISEFTG